MKRKKLIRKLQEMGCVLVRHGGAHDWYMNPKIKQSHHVEINENLAKSIIKKLSNI